MDKIIKLEKEVIQLRNITKMLMWTIEKMFPNNKRIVDIKELNFNLEWVGGQ